MKIETFTPTGRRKTKVEYECDHDGMIDDVYHVTAFEPAHEESEDKSKQICVYITRDEFLRMKRWFEQSK